MRLGAGGVDRGVDIGDARRAGGDGGERALRGVAGLGDDEMVAQICDLAPGLITSPVLAGVRSPWPIRMSLRV